MIPLYAVSQARGQIYSVDDPIGVNDFMAVDGSGGTSYVPYFLTTLFQLTKTLGYYDLRKYRQRFDAASAVTFSITPWRDGKNTGQTIIRTFASADVGVTSTPLFYSGSDFQVFVQLSGFTSEVQLGNASVSATPRRHSRATGAGSNPLLTYTGFGPYDGRYVHNAVLTG